MLYEDAQEIRLAKQTLCMLRLAVQLAQEMGTRLGSGEILFGALPAHGRGAACRIDRAAALEWIGSRSTPYEPKPRQETSMKAVSLGVACGLVLCALSAHAADPVPLKKSDGVLVDAKGMTVYTFDKDAANSGKSACSGHCAENWPPVQAGGAQPAAPYSSSRAKMAAVNWPITASRCTPSSRTRNRATRTATRP
jgi:predicted lipoprotein with Yx(FWY)xxD motif